MKGIFQKSLSGPQRMLQKLDKRELSITSTRRFSSDRRENGLVIQQTEQYGKCPPPPQILMAVERERDFAEMWGDLSTSIKVKKIFGVL